MKDSMNKQKQKPTFDSTINSALDVIAPFNEVWAVFAIGISAGPCGAKSKLTAPYTASPILLTAWLDLVMKDAEGFKQKVRERIEPSLLQQFDSEMHRFKRMSPKLERLTKDKYEATKNV
jgi:hypothetical protein